MDWMIWVWTALIVITLVFEFITSELICIWFSAAGIVSLILSLCGVIFWVQIIVFFAVSIALLISLRKICLKLLKGSKEKTNLDRIIGRRVQVIEPITKHKPGTIKVNDVIWSCVEISDTPVESGTEVEIVEISGNKIVVKGV